MSASFRLAVIGGDGIGPEVTRAALRVLDAAERRFDFSTVREELRWSSARYVDSASRITPEDIDGLRAFDAVLFGAIGEDYREVTRDAMYVDAACMWLVLKPEQFDTIVTTNLFGDILTDLGAAICGGLGVAASGNIHPGQVSMFEPVHGSAPKYAGKGVASPIGSIGAVALMLEYLGQSHASRAIENAVRGGLQSGRIKGVEAGSQRTEEVANIVAMAVAG